MDQKIYRQYLEKYVLEALEKKNDNASAAADYKTRPSNAPGNF